MFEPIFKKRMFSQLLIMFCMFGFALPSYGAVVFEDNFDAQANWAKGKPTASEVDYPPFPASGAPANWSTWRAVPWNPPVADPISITNAVTSDHTKGTGKAFIATVQACGSDIFSIQQFCSDTILAKILPQEHQELYVRFWLKTKAGWQYAANQNNYHKIFRFLRYDGSGNFFQNGTSGSESPLLFFDLSENWSGGAAKYMLAARGYPVSSYNGATMSNNEIDQSFGGAASTANGMWADGQWHRYDIRAKLNNTGSADGIVEFWFDGVKKFSATNAKFKLSGSNSIGWNAFQIGGNQQTHFSAGEQWYAIDDVVVSTTPIPDNYVIGGGAVADTTAPAVSISSPANNTTVSGAVSITANASDAVGVSKVEFYVNNVLKSTDTSAPYAYSWDTAAVASGTYTLMAKAYDAAGNVGQSSSVSVSIYKDTTVPTVSLTSPANNAIVSGTVAITASAADNIGVSKVEFYRNGTLMAAGNVAPYSYNWNTTSVANGAYTLTAKAFDASNNVATSATVTVTVNNVTADTTAPATSITSPAAGATVSGTVNIAASASDNVGVSKVEFYVNGALKGTDTTSPYSYSWSTTSVANGAYSLTSKAYDAAGNSATSSAVSISVSNNVTQAGYSIWSATSVPGHPDAGADSPVELGLKFKSDTSGYVTGVRFYKSSKNTGTHVGNLWTTAGTRLATATFTNETASGWQQVNFSTPVAITANTVYVVSYHTSVGHYSDDLNYFNGKGQDNAPLHALANGVSGANSVYAYGSGSSFPQSSGNSVNYWVDVVFSSAVTADTTAPATSITSPAAGATVSGTVNIAASASDNVGVSKVEIYVNGTLKGTYSASPYSYSWNTTSVANGAYSLTSKAYDAAGNVSQSPSVSVNVNNASADTTAPATSITSPVAGATLSGSVTIAASASDNVGVSKVEFYANGALMGTDTTSPYSYSWSTTSVANGAYSLTSKAYDAAGNSATSSAVSISVSNNVTQESYSIWSSTSVPGHKDAGADSPVELGLKFKSDTSGYVTGVRFYKSSKNTGTHVGNLWTTAGTRLATATFTNETASGWQQVNFSTPVAITANTVYVVSYHTNVGHYSDDLNYFKGKGQDKAPLHALANGVSGANSVFAYGSGSNFPTQSSGNSVNYWVDVVFKK